ncbi:hypothetical protein PHLGIDRAFT_126501 [Phlebiopsis gigantea 11061_1 CR5-6]|uniref:Single-stranded DNA-binding protein n=1 Tax=Phlebiopsis gigantea (strain 11061_1 CR5-6) TaxID=745531 RepID=A0A0C3NV30_PHLG1|nr:hypothetical protein PHLGIDRAFT_126501 [Phlebiopsis gigantea 11061_1 CR5-6]
MFAATRRAAPTGSFTRTFSTTSRRQADLAKLTLIGRLGKTPEVRTTKTDKEYVSYTVATTNAPPPPNPDGTRGESTTSWHTIVSFSPAANNYLRTLQKGWQVYVEANYELRDANPNAEPDSPAAQRQILLRHEHVRVLKRTPSAESQSHDD